MLPENLYQTVNVDDWGSLVQEYEKLLKSNNDSAEKEWIFRGQKRTLDRRIDFISSLERAAESFGLKEKYRLSQIEEVLSREFRRKLHHYTSYVPNESDTLELSALMQHYGAPTRLLDWTYSFYVATFFAVEVEEMTYDGWYEVWALNAKWFSAETIKPDPIRQERNVARDKASAEKKDVPIAQQQAIIDYLLKEKVAAVQNVNPYNLNERLTIQRGLFLFPGDIDCTFEGNLKATGYAVKSPNNLYRFKIERKARKEILEKLFEMNINRAVLFPDLDGFARSLWTRLATPRTFGLIADNATR